MEESRLRHLFSTIDSPQAKFSLAGISVKAITFKFSVFSVCSVVIKPFWTGSIYTQKGLLKNPVPLCVIKLTNQEISLAMGRF